MMILRIFRKKITGNIIPKLSLENKKRWRFDIVCVHPKSGKPFSSFHGKG
jgi:hypothetical protein